MNRLLIACAAALCLAAPLSACAPVLQSSPLEQTLVDDKALLAAEAAYFGVGTLVEAAVDSGALRGERAAQVAVLDRQAYAALATARQAYAVGNAASYRAAAAAALGAVADIQRLLKPQPG